MKKILTIFLCLLCLSVVETAAQSISGIQKQDTANAEISEQNDLKACGFPFSDNNRVTFLKTGHDKFEDLFQHIKQARTFIHMEYFNFRNDSINAILISLLHEKVKDGVEVRVMYDAFGNSSNNRPFSRAKHDSITAHWAYNLRSLIPYAFPGSTTSIHATTGKSWSSTECMPIRVE